MKARVKAFAAMMLVLGVAGTQVVAQSLVPKLDDTGAAGDVARQMKKKSADRFDLADIDKDGKLSRAEATAISAYWAENFDKRDKNRDNFLTWEEFIGHNRWPK